MTGVIRDAEVAFYCVVDGLAYLPKAITALGSIRRFHPEATYYVVGALPPQAERLTSRFDIHLAHVDLSHVFRPTEATPERRVTWPSECFWWTRAYSLFADLGFAYSCAVDGDVLGVAPIHHQDAFREGVPVAGVAKRNGRLNSGVLFFDNRSMTDVGFFEKIVDIYANAKDCSHSSCSGYCRARGDQGLLWEIERRHGIVPGRLANRYNHMLGWRGDKYLEKNPEAPLRLEDSSLLHLILKPWRRPPLFRRLPSLALEAYREWWRFAHELWPDRRERRALLGTPCRVRIARPT